MSPIIYIICVALITSGTLIGYGLGYKHGKAMEKIKKTTVLQQLSTTSKDALIKEALELGFIKIVPNNDDTRTAEAK